MSPVVESPAGDVTAASTIVCVSVCVCQTLSSSSTGHPGAKLSCFHAGRVQESWSLFKYVALPSTGYHCPYTFVTEEQVFHFTFIQSPPFSVSVKCQTYLSDDSSCACMLINYKVLLQTSFKTFKSTLINFFLL